jgi:hypothetical protein
MHRTIDPSPRPPARRGATRRLPAESRGPAVDPGRRLALALAFWLAVSLAPAPALAEAASASADPAHDHSHADTHDGAHDGAHSGTHASRPDAHAPIGVMGEHVHHAGGWMVSYRYMRMEMEPNRSGESDVSPAQILRPVGPYGAVPTRMTMDMHMFGIMYAPSDRVTLMGMFPFLDVTMDHLNMMRVPFTTESTGIGDIGASALVELFEREGHQLLLNAGMTFPTGSIDRTGVTPVSSGANVVLPYPMQLGSGTWDLRPGLTYNGRALHFSWGAQVMGTIRLGRNDQNYRLGHAYHATGWGAWKIARWISASGRLEWRQWFDIVGQDSRLTTPNPGLFPTPGDFIPTADPDLRAGKRLDVGPGLNFIVPSGPMKGVRLAVEALFPVYQSLDGPQLAADWTLVVGTQYAF